jgi:alpha-tubulin suppressor-like RCC1 family protein
MYTVVNVSVGYDFTCATTVDTSIYCWGYNGYGVIGNGQASGNAYSPSAVLAETGGDGGTAVQFTGASSVQINSYYSVCARKSADGSIWCWGDDSSNGYLPVRYTQQSIAVQNTFVLCPNGASDPSFIDLNGDFNYQGEPATTQISCN